MYAVSRIVKPWIVIFFAGSAFVPLILNKTLTPPHPTKLPVGRPLTGSMAPAAVVFGL